MATAKSLSKLFKIPMLQESKGAAQLRNFANTYSTEVSLEDGEVQFINADYDMVFNIRTDVDERDNTVYVGTITTHAPMKVLFSTDYQTSFPTMLKMLIAGAQPKLVKPPSVTNIVDTGVVAFRKAKPIRLSAVPLPVPKQLIKKELNAKLTNRKLKSPK